MWMCTHLDLVFDKSKEDLEYLLMSETLSRLATDNVLRTTIVTGFNDLKDYVDIPSVLDDTHILASCRIARPPIISDSFFSRVLRTSDALSSVVTDTDKSIYPDWLMDFQRTNMLRMLHDKYKSEVKHNSKVVLVRDEIARSIQLDWESLQRTAEILGEVASVGASLFIVGSEISTEPEIDNSGFAGKLTGILPVRHKDVFTLEPVIQGKDGEIGLLPSGILLRGLYSIIELPEGAKKELVAN